MIFRNASRSGTIHPAILEKSRGRISSIPTSPVNRPAMKKLTL